MINKLDSFSRSKFYSLTQHFLIASPFLASFIHSIVTEHLLCSDMHCTLQSKTNVSSGTLYHIEQNSTSSQIMLPGVLNSNRKFKEDYWYFEVGESKAGDHMIRLQASQ